MCRLTVANLEKADLPAANRIYRLAFGTQFQLADPMAFAGDSNVLAARLGANPDGAWGAWLSGQLVGSCFGSLWGSLGVIGPLTVTPALWRKGIAQQLLAPVLDWLASRGANYMALSTIPTSPDHLMLYRKFGFHPRFLYAIMLKPAIRPDAPPDFTRFSNLTTSGREAALDTCQTFCHAFLEGLDFRSEVESVFRQGIGDTIFIRDAGGVAGFGVCHFGRGSEAESGVLYLKAGAVRSGEGAEARFKGLLDGAAAFAAEAGLRRIRAGVNYGRTAAFEAMLQYGCFIEKTGVAMHRPNHAFYNRPGVYLVDDWR